MYKEKIMCGLTTGDGIRKLNNDIDKATKEGYKAIDISGTSDPEGEICVLLCRKA